MERVDTQWGGRESGRGDLEALTSIVIGSWSICKACMMLRMKYHGRALPVHVYPPDFKTREFLCSVVQATRKLRQHRPGIKTLHS